MSEDDRIDHIREDVRVYVSRNTKTLLLVSALIFAMLTTAHIKGCIRDHRKKAVPPRPVSTAMTVKGDVPLYVETFGNLASPQNVDIKSQVTGKVSEVDFTEGQHVSAGDLLFTIDPREYVADLDRAEAVLEEDLADLSLKKDTLERNRQLFEKNLISNQDYGKYLADVASAEAKVQSDMANVELARINVEYCYIRSPINGVTGKRLVDIGNIVPANTGPVLVNIKSLSPLYVDFTLPEKHLSPVREAMKCNDLDIYLYPEGDGGGPYRGSLRLVDNSVDNTTGTVSLRGAVDNSAGKLWPGQFVDVTLVLDTVKGATLVPYEAVAMGQKGHYVFSVKDDGTADLDYIATGQRQGDYVVVNKGLDPGVKVVTQGQLGLSPGAPVVEVPDKRGKKYVLRSLAVPADTGTAPGATGTDADKGTAAVLTTQEPGASG